MEHLRAIWLRRFGRTKAYCPGVNKLPENRLNLEQTQAGPRREGRQVVKGTNKRVVVVKSPAPDIFEQAIFIVRDSGRSAAEGETDILREAERVANEYLGGVSRVRSRLSRAVAPAVYALLGAVFTGLVWLGLHLLGI